MTKKNSAAPIITPATECQMGGGRMGPCLNGAGVVITDIPCPLCASSGRLSVGRATPNLRHLESDTNDLPRLFCGRHGWVTREEITTI